MSKKILVSTVLIATGLGVTGTAIASGPGSWRDGSRAEFRAQMLEQRFAELDADGDGSVTQAEIEAFRQARFERADKDGDGLLSQEEAMAEDERMSEEAAARRFAAMDKNGDGGLSPDEIGDPVMGMFERLDRNEDGALSQEEFERLAKRGRRGGSDWR